MKAFLEYRTQIQELAFLVDQNKIPPCKLLNYITRHYECSEGISFYRSFFQGEYFFFSENYAGALHSYLSSTLIPYHTFFCYRAAAYLAKKNDLLMKALSFAKKAETIDRMDYSNSKIIKLLEQVDSIAACTQEEQNEPKTFSLGREERNALNDLFLNEKDSS